MHSNITVKIQAHYISFCLYSLSKICVFLTYTYKNMCSERGLFWFLLHPPGDDIGGQEEEDSPQLLRTRSDASFVHIQRRSKTHSARDLQRLRTHRFSINGHFYNHKVPRTEHNVMWPTVDTTPGTRRRAFLFDCARFWVFAEACCEMISFNVPPSPRLHQVSPEHSLSLLAENGFQLQGFPLCFRYPVQNVQGVQVQEQVLMQWNPQAFCVLSVKFLHVFLSSALSSVYYGTKLIVQYLPIRRGSRPSS